MCSEVAVDGADDMVTENALGRFGRTMEAGQDSLERAKFFHHIIMSY